MKLPEAIVYKDLIISTIVDTLANEGKGIGVYKDLIISTIVDVKSTWLL